MRTWTNTDAATLGKDEIDLQTAPHKPTLLIDFDGVIHSYDRGWQNGVIYGTVIPGFFAWTEEATKLFRLAVYSSRCSSKEGMVAMYEWFHERAKTYFDTVTATFGKCDFSFALQRGASEPVILEFVSRKPAAFLTIDDRAVQFRGDWSAWWLKPETLIGFKPWNVTK